KPVPLIPDEVEITDKTDEGLTLEFRSDAGGVAAIALLRGQLAALVARLVKEIGAGQAVPIDRGSLQIGQTFAVTAHQVQRRGDGARRLVMTVDLPDQGRVVTIPLELSPDDVRSLIKDLS